MAPPSEDGPERYHIVANGKYLARAPLRRVTKALSPYAHTGWLSPYLSPPHMPTCHNHFLYTRLLGV